GVAVAKMLVNSGAGDVTVCDSRGIIHAGRQGLNPAKERLAEATNAAGLRGDAAAALRGADVLVGVSGARLDEAAVAGMAPEALVFALANPTPEVDPAVAAKYASVVATGRSDLPNQINNVLAFPGIFAGALDARAKAITPEMTAAASRAIAECVGDDELAADYVVPSPLDPRVGPAVRTAVARAAGN
ncbi:MAG: malic enzyme-like NAD(P)-binding protein, partial [Stackebrandtia sp.]